MALLRWDPHEMDRFRGDMSRLWNRMREDWNLDSSRPRTHLHQIENGYLVEVELPGVDPELVDIEVDEESISIRGQFPGTPIENEAREGESFHATIGFPSAIDPETADANYQHGLLRITVHKTSTRRRRIDIRPKSVQ